LETETAKPDLWNDPAAANTLFTKLKSLRKQWEPLQSLSENVDTLMALAEALALSPNEASDGSDTRELEKEVDKALKEWSVLETQLYLSGEFDAGNCYLTLSGGAGGTEAQDWASILLRMYLRFCERKGWNAEIMEKTDQRLVGLGIGPGTNHVERYYPNSVANVGVREMPDKLADVIREAIANYNTF